MEVNYLCKLSEVIGKCCSYSCSEKYVTDIKWSHNFSFACQGWTRLCPTSNFCKILPLIHSSLLNGKPLPDSSKSCIRPSMMELNKSNRKCKAHPAFFQQRFGGFVLKIYTIYVLQSSRPDFLILYETRVLTSPFP